MDAQTSMELTKILNLGADIIKEMDVPLPTYIRVLCVDDDVFDFELLSGVLSRSKKITYRTEAANTYSDALAMIRENRHDIYLVDFKLGGPKTGLELIKECIAAGFYGPFLIWSGMVHEAVYEEALNTSTIINYISKDETNIIVLDNVLRYSIKNWRIYNRVRKFQACFNSLKQHFPTVG